MDICALALYLLCVSSCSNFFPTVMINVFCLGVGGFGFLCLSPFLREIIGLGGLWNGVVGWTVLCELDESSSILS